MKEPVRILSDLHLGHAASRVESVTALRPLLEGAGTVVFNGDTWQELADDFRPLSRRMLGELESLCAELGVEPVFLSGNHDPGWAGKGWVELAGGRVLVTHGDAVLWAGSPWSREAFAREAGVRELWEAHREAEDDAGERLRLARRIAVVLQAESHPQGRSFLSRVRDALNPPRRAWEILRIWAEHGRATAGFAEHYFPRARFVVVGHFHCPGVWRHRGRTVLNTGAFVRPHSPRWVEWADGVLSYGKVRRGERGWERAGAAREWRLGEEESDKRAACPYR